MASGTRLPALVCLVLVITADWLIADEISSPPLVTIHPPQGHVFSDAGISEQNLLVTAGGHQVVSWDLGTGKQRKVLDAKPGTQFLALTRDNRFCVERSLPGSPDGMWLSMIQVWNFEKRGRFMKQTKTLGPPLFSPDSQMLAYPEWKRHKNQKERQESPLSVVLLDLKTRKTQRTVEAVGGYNTFVFSDDHRLLALSRFTDSRVRGSVTVWDTTAAKEVQFFDNIDPSMPVFSSDGRYLLLDREVYEVATGKLAYEHRGVDVPGMRFIRFTPDGRRVLGRDMVGGLYVWDLDRDVTVTWRAQDEKISDLAVTPDSRLLITSEWDQDKVNVWNIDTQQRVARLGVKVPPSTYPRAKLSRDGEYLMVFSVSELSVWKTSTFRKAVPQQIAQGKGNRPALAGNGQAGAGLLRPKWASVLSGIPDGVDLRIARHHDLCQNADAKLGPKSERLSRTLAGRFMQPNAANYYYPKRVGTAFPDFELLGSFSFPSEEGLPGGKPITFALSSEPIDSDSVTRALRMDRSVRNVRNREFLGEHYVVGSKVFYHPDPHTLFVAESTDAIEAVIRQRKGKPSSLAQEVNQTLKDHQFVIIGQEQQLQAILEGERQGRLKQAFATAANFAEVSMVQQKLKEDRENWLALKRLIVKGNITGRPALTIVAETADDQAAQRLRSEIVDCFRRLTGSPEDTPLLMYGFRADTNVGVQGRSLTVSSLPEPDNKLLERFLKPDDGGN